MRSPSLRTALFTLAGLTGLCALLVRDAARPPAPDPASAPTTDFSAERAMRHVRAIAQRPHPVGSEDNARIREYLLAELRSLGLSPEVQEATGVGTRYREAGQVKNVLARLPGRTPGGQSVVLMAHYDGVAGGPAAGDDAAGTAAILETLRALKAGPQLEHDVIALITDGEEAGLLGAAAFVREHLWAKDVGVALNFEARGTRGRSYMFETGPGNLDAVRVLADVPDVSATSLSVTVYRSLPNDTDLSELAVLGRPAFNFAFADGVERYHTAHDDVAHLDPGSLQHHGDQALALTRAFGNGPLPRPATGDAVFFDLPLVGLVVYPEGWTSLLAIIALTLMIASILRLSRSDGRWLRSAALGVLGTVCGVSLTAVVAHLVGNAIGEAHVATGSAGAPAFRGIYAAAIAMLAVTLSLAAYAAVRRWSSVSGLHLGALAVWTALTLFVSIRLPGASFLLVWPLIATTIAARVRIRATAGVREPAVASPAVTVTLWVATAIAMATVVPVIYAVSAVLLGTIGPGGTAAAMLTALLAWLLVPHLDALGAGHPWRATTAALVVSLGLIGVGAATVRSSPEHPVPSSVIYAMDADRTEAWLVSRGLTQNRNTRADTTRPAGIPAWLTDLRGSGGPPVFTSASRASIDPPTATVLADSVSASGRELVLRLRAAPGTGVLALRANGAPVVRASVDGRPIDTSRYRSPVRQWRLDYSAPPDSGFTLALSVATPGSFALELSAHTPGLPPVAGVRLPERPPSVVTVHTGDATIVHRSIRFD